MYRRLCSAVVVPALLILLTAGAVQARPLTVQAAPAGLLTQAWQALSSTWTGLWIKEAEGMDPNGVKSHRPLSTPRVRGADSDRAPAGR